VFDHVTIRVADRSASERFYATVLATLGIERDHSDDHGVEWEDFSLGQTTPGHPVTRGLHIAFVAPSRAHVDAFWDAGTAAGAPDDGPPGPRPQYRDDYYGAFLRDHDGNSAEAVHHGALRRGPGYVDHLWIRVRDVAAARSFYEQVAPHAGFAIGTDTPERVLFRGSSGSFSVVAGPPTEHVHVAFGVDDDARVQAFHRELVAAGYQNNGAPGERSEYHPGYYGAFVLDPDGNNVELVNHHR
jgi:catechol 2,3-dioxygenase-like lactoylglutathione lyase family enzyme